MQQKKASEGTRKSTNKKKPEIAKAISADMPVVAVAKSSKPKSQAGESDASKGHRRTSPSAAKSAAAPSSSEVVTAPVAHQATAKSSHAAHKSNEHKSISRDSIAHLAYSYWVSRGHSHGSAEEDWLRAERHLTSK